LVRKWTDAGFEELVVFGFVDWLPFDW
jgi:hypothetical protein